MGVWGSGPFDNDVAADLLGYLSEHDPGRRREIVELIVQRARERKEVHWMDSPSEVVGAAAVLAASLPGGEAEAAEIARLQFDVGAVVLPGLNLSWSMLRSKRCRASPGGTAGGSRGG
jgi:hypothetical protein